MGSLLSLMFIDSYLNHVPLMMISYVIITRDFKSLIPGFFIFACVMEVAFFQVPGMTARFRRWPGLE